MLFADMEYYSAQRIADLIVFGSEETGNVERVEETLTHGFGFYGEAICACVVTEVPEKRLYSRPIDEGVRDLEERGFSKRQIELFYSIYDAVFKSKLEDSINTALNVLEQRRLHLTANQMTFSEAVHGGAGMALDWLETKLEDRYLRSIGGEVDYNEEGFLRSLSSSLAAHIFDAARSNNNMHYEILNPET